MNLTENKLDEWVRGNANEAQGVIVELVWRLVAASSPQPKERRFPLGDSLGQHGPDGFLDVDYAYDPFVPKGKSVWEIGTGLRARDKATSDYSDLVEAIPESVRLESTFVFVTPLSGRRDWEHTWKEGAQREWLESRMARNEWRDVRVIDGTKLIDWTRQFPPVELWLAQRTIGPAAHQIETPEQRWSLLRTFGEPPPLTPKLFLADREEACTKLREVVAGTTVQLKLNTHFPDHVVDFVCAYLADLDADARLDAAGRWLVVSDAEAWKAMAAQGERLVLVADSSLDLCGETGTKLIQQARRFGHAVVFGGPAGGVPDPASAPLRAPRAHHVREALELAGYKEERARILAQRSDGNLGSLLRCLQNLSSLPEWAESTLASELVIAAVLGSWSEDSTADRAIAEGLSGNSYGEWIGKMREVALRPGTPLSQRDASWKFTARYEGWYALGPNLFDEHLRRLRKAAVAVLTEKDPQFDLPSDERHAAGIHGKVLAHSRLLRKGIAESLALLGSHPKALTSCKLGNAELTAALAVREILADAGWERWASLNNLLPLLAEAAPGEFLDAVETALTRDPGPFDQLFAQEGDAVFGSTYMSGLLWAMETLAWDPTHLGRVVICLGELAQRDPGGRWSNRPAHSLTTILLPWMPQTCAPIPKRAAAVSTLLAELPEIGWKLLVSLLPDRHSSSMGTHKPAWRETIPDEWAKGVTHAEFWEQSSAYSEMAIAAAKGNSKRLAVLIGHLNRLPAQTQEKLMMQLMSDPTRSLPDADKLVLWTEVVDLVSKHRRFSDAEWAMKSEQLDMLAAVADRLAPNAPVLRVQRLFCERDVDLFVEKGNYEEQRKELELRRQRAVKDVIESGGTKGLLAFAASVESPWRVGLATGAVAGTAVDQVVLPALLAPEQNQLSRFAAGFVWSRYRIGGWQWVDGIDTTGWTPLQIAEFLSFLPFVADTWERAARLLGGNEAAYWSQTSANPYDADAGLEWAVDRLMHHGRPHAALRCINRMLDEKQPIDSDRAVRALLAALTSGEASHPLDTYQTVEIIKALQANPAANPQDLLLVEWAYLPLLDRHSDATPKLLWRRLATEPRFFCEVIRIVFRSKRVERATEQPPEEHTRIAGNAYRLLSEWRWPPGSAADGTYDGEALIEWLDAVKKECSETGHLEVAMLMLGNALTHVPADPDGLWIHRSAAAALNAKDAGDMRDGFRTELFNARGVHMFTAGREEYELATKYRAQAESVEEAGFHRLATTLRELAETYELEGERQSTTDPFEG